jgi:hypothetical protein
MPPKLDPKSDRVEACHRAVLALVAKNDNSENKAAKAAGLKQQKLNKFISSRSLGIDFADQIAAAYETTVDGLVWRFLKGGEGSVRAGDLTGWAKAVEEAEGTWPDYPYEAAAEVRLPIAPRVATKEFVGDLAGVLHRYAKGSGTRVRAQKAAK